MGLCCPELSVVYMRVKCATNFMFMFRKSALPDWDFTLIRFNSSMPLRHQQGLTSTVSQYKTQLSLKAFISLSDYLRPEIVKKN